MKTLTFDATPEGKLRFKLTLLAAYNPDYRFQSPEELRAHAKLLDAIEGISVADANVEGGRSLASGAQTLTLDDAWLQLLVRMASPPVMNWSPGGNFGRTTRHVATLLDFYAAASTPPATPPSAS